MKTSRRSTIVCITILSFLIAQQAFAIRLLSPQERKGELRGHLDKNPPIPIYGPDSIILSYVDKGRIETVTDQSGALTLAVSVDAVESVLKSGRSEIVKTKYQGNQPQTIEKSLEMLKVKFGKGVHTPRLRKSRRELKRPALFWSRRELFPVSLSKAVGRFWIWLAMRRSTKRVKPHPKGLFHFTLRFVVRDLSPSPSFLFMTYSLLKGRRVRLAINNQLLNNRKLIL